MFTTRTLFARVGYFLLGTVCIGTVLLLKVLLTPW
jgi:hypothetical protein